MDREPRETVRLQDETFPESERSAHVITPCRVAYGDRSGQVFGH